MVELPAKLRRDIARGRNKEHVGRIVDIELNHVGRPDRAIRVKGSHVRSVWIILRKRVGLSNALAGTIATTSRNSPMDGRANRSRAEMAGSRNILHEIRFAGRRPPN